MAVAGLANRPTRMSLASNTFWPSHSTQPSAMPRYSLRLMMRFRSRWNFSSRAVGRTWPMNLTSPTDSARPDPGPPSQPSVNPRSCHRASMPRQPGMTGSSSKWHWKNQRSGLMSNSASTSPLPLAPPSSEMWVMRSNISIGGSGSRALPCPNSRPCAQSRRSE